jgi:hypothetical protein
VSLGALESLEEAEEGRPKLDGIGCLGHGGLVHVQERIIVDGAWASVPLGDHTGGREVQVGRGAASWGRAYRVATSAYRQSFLVFSKQN